MLNPPYGYEFWSISSSCRLAGVKIVNYYNVFNLTALTAFHVFVKSSTANDIMESAFTTLRCHGGIYICGMQSSTADNNTGL